MKRGELWTLRDDRYASKARPVVIIQSDSLQAFDSIILCLFTTFESEHIHTRVLIPSNPSNGLAKDSYVMTDKIVTVSKNELGENIGVLTSEQMEKITEQLAVILGI